MHAPLFRLYVYSDLADISEMFKYSETSYRGYRSEISNEWL